MSWDQIKGKWMQFKSKAKEQWAMSPTMIETNSWDGFRRGMGLPKKKQSGR